MAIVFETNNITINGHPVVRTGMIITPHVVGGSSGAGVPNSSFPEFLSMEVKLPTRAMVRIQHIIGN